MHRNLFSRTDGRAGGLGGGGLDQVLAGFEQSFQRVLSDLEDFALESLFFFQMLLQQCLSSDGMKLTCV
jgi:hypothetical protein